MVRPLPAFLAFAFAASTAAPAATSAAVQAPPPAHAARADELRARAEQGDAGAQLSLGLMYAIGQGVPRDYAQAAAWYRKAAEQG